jgi:hypothetical protein
MKITPVILSLLAATSVFACQSEVPTTEKETVTNLICSEAVKLINFNPIGPLPGGEYSFSFQVTNRTGYTLRDFQFGYMCVAQSGTVLKTERLNMFYSIGPRTNLNAGWSFTLFNVPSQTDHFVGVLLSFHIDDYVPPLTQSELDAAAKKTSDDQAARKVENAAKALKYNQALAASGDAYGQLRMGERYRDGDGVAKDLRAAREWFAKAAAQGDKVAAKELAQLVRN